MAYIWLVCVPEVRGFVVYEEVVKVLPLEGVRAPVQQSGALVPHQLPGLKHIEIARVLIVKTKIYAFAVCHHSIAYQAKPSRKINSLLTVRSSLMT